MPESRAAVLVGERRVEIRRFALPELSDDDALLRIEATGVCGSDVGAYYGGFSDFQVPCVFGHEFVGRIDSIGGRAAQRWGVGEGDRVVVEEYLPCGTCVACLEGTYQVCAEPRYGTRSVDDAPTALTGGYADYVYLHPQSLVTKVPDGVDPIVGQLYIPIANGIHWVSDVGGARPGSTVAIIGPGPHGLGCVIAAKEAGAGRVVLIGRGSDVPRLEMGRALGADVIVNGDSEDVEAAVLAATHGAGADTVINAAPSAAAVGTAVAIAKDRGTIVLASSGPGSLSGDALWVVILKMLTLRGVRGRPSRHVPSALALIASNRYPVAQMCTAIFDVEQTAAALEAVHDDPSVIRAVVTSA